MATAPANCAEIAKIRLTKEPQKDAKCFGAFDSPPNLVSPSSKNGYMLIEVQ